MKDLEYIEKVSSIRYKIKNYSHNQTSCKAKCKT